MKPYSCVYSCELNSTFLRFCVPCLRIPALQSLWGEGDYKQEMDEMLTEQAAIEAAPRKSTLQFLRDCSVRWQLLTMSVVYCCNQLSGIPAVRTDFSSFFLAQTMKVAISQNKINTHVFPRSISSLLTSSKRPAYQLTRSAM